MKTFGKILLWIGGGLFVLAGPAVIASWGGMGADPIEGVYFAGLTLGFVLGLWYSYNQKQKEWIEFKRTHRYERRKDLAS